MSARRGLAGELGFRREIQSRPHEALLAVFHTAGSLRKRAARFFRERGVTDVQFNLMMLLAYQAPEDRGLKQTELSRMLLVNRANVTALLDRMEKARLVRRVPTPDDRRAREVLLTPRGRELVGSIEQDYHREVEGLVQALGAEDRERLISILERLRASIRSAPPLPRAAGRAP